ncbi:MULTISPECIES: CorA family divalent cation transporter [Vibrio]|uniref:Zinc transporter ZntB n=1 Tax=Vibrio casei TaxID=673372 RepID=A0A368LQA5_9VIBR|nr:MULTISPECIES: CorA family divalent cation transporter [Vibrio]RCS74018.1 zinc transporter ZntB [Vibrio casei]SJN18288.1 Magnesium and cobalt transport protein CorA [Vibrio casei]HBV75747.1 zinc transporter ZntB [Vibrio sp.]
MTDNFLIDQWQFNGVDAQQIKVQDEHQSKVQPRNWYHCQRESLGLRKWLQFNDIEPGIIDSLLKDDTRPRFELYEDGSFLLILRGVNLNEGAKPDDMLSIRLFWRDNSLITTRKVSSRTISNIRSALLKGNGPKSLPHLLMAIIAGLNLNIEKFLNQTEERLFELDEVEHDDNELHLIHKRILKLRRFLKPQRYALNDLVEANIPDINSVETHSWNVLDTSTRLTESMEFYLEQIQVMKSEIAQDQAEKMNRNTYLFTIVAAIFLPLGFLTGLLGINIGGMPGVDSPTAFTLFCAGLGVTLLIELFLLKWLRFF